MSLRLFKKEEKPVPGRQEKENPGAFAPGFSLQTFGLLVRAACAEHLYLLYVKSRRCSSGCRTTGLLRARDLHGMAYMVSQLGSISGELIGFARRVGQCEGAG